MFEDMIKHLIIRYRLDEDAAVDVLLELSDLSSLKRLASDYHSVARAVLPPTAP